MTPLRFLRLGLMLAAAALLAMTARGFAADSAPDSAEQQSDVLQYLDQTINWYRSIQALRLTPDSVQESVILQSVQHDALKALRRSFDYAYAEAAILEPVAADADGGADNGDAAPADSATPNSGKLAAFHKNVTDNMAAVQKQITAVDHALARATPAQRAKLQDQRKALEGALSLAQAQNDLLTKLKGFLTSQKTNDRSFLGAIKTLAQTFPELKPGTAAVTTTGDTDSAAKADASPAAANPLSPEALTGQNTADTTSAARETTGIIAAITDFLPLWRRAREIDALITQVANLEKANETLRTDLRTDLIAAGSQGREMTAQSGVALAPVGGGDADSNGDNATPPSDAAPAPLPTGADFDRLTARFKLLSAAVIPLGEQHVAFETSRAELVQWRSVLTHEFASSLCRLLIRLFILAVLILIPLGMSEVSRRAANRYVKDSRRRRQLRTVRRAFVSTVVGIVVFLSLFAEVGSLATYVGLLTAGVAVALQQVILSMFAYLFFFGRFGVRVGERVTIGGVTGEVIEVGLLRVYLMEHVGGKPSGRVAVFPNLVFFQPAAFYKQIADTNYGWQSMTLTFAADTDQVALRQKLLAVANAIYTDYYEGMRKQQAALESATNLRVAIPHPECMVQAGDHGVAATLRYPVEPGREEEINKRMTDAVMAAVKTDPQLKLATSETNTAA